MENKIRKTLDNFENSINALYINNNNNLVFFNNTPGIFIQLGLV